MADVDLDVHGVRYAQIHMDLRRDMRLQGFGFIALLDFTTVDTLKASLERVITDKSRREGKVEAMCYYKKRRRGAVTIRTQRDVMLACCEYPLVTRTGKPAPDTYIRVGVLLEGYDDLGYRESLKSALDDVNTMPGIPVTPPLGTPSHTVIGSLVRMRPKNAKGELSTRIVYRKILRPNDKTPVIIAEPQPKRQCLAESMGWQLVGPASPAPLPMEIKPVRSDSESPDITIPTPPSLPMEIKSEPLDAEEEPSVHYQNNHFNPSTSGSPRNHNNASQEKSSLKNEPVSDNTSDEEEYVVRTPPPHLVDVTPDPGLKVMWEQLKKMESRLSDMEGVGAKQGSPAPPDLTSSDEGACAPRATDLTSKMAALERRLLVIEHSREQQGDPQQAMEKRIAVMEKNIARTMSSVDKLGKSLMIINRKHIKTNSVLDVMFQSVKKIRESQVVGESTLEEIQRVLNKSDS